MKVTAASQTPIVGQFRQKSESVNQNGICPTDPNASRRRGRSQPNNELFPETLMNRFFFLKSSSLCLESHGSTRGSEATNEKRDCLVVDLRGRRGTRRGRRSPGGSCGIRRASTSDTSAVSYE